jgi:dihydrofolate reductase
MVLLTDRNGNIGLDNDLLFWFKEDLKRFKALTKGKIVVMGRKTWESLPSKLPSRTNVVLTSNVSNVPELKGERPDLYFTGFNNILELSKTEEVWIIGGESLYSYYSQYANEVYWTCVDTQIHEADTCIEDYYDKLMKPFGKMETEMMDLVDNKSNRTYFVEFRKLSNRR